MSSHARQTANGALEKRFDSGQIAMFPLSVLTKELYKNAPVDIAVFLFVLSATVGVTMVVILLHEYQIYFAFDRACAVVRLFVADVVHPDAVSGGRYGSRRSG